MRSQFDRYRGLSRNARLLFTALLILLIVAVLYAIFSTQLGQNALLLCCGGVLLLIVVGVVSERGMR